MARATETRERILHAAEEVVLRHGVAHLTLEAAAGEAGVSKGGVLYHFPSRAALVAAMVEKLNSAFERDLRRHRRDGEGPGAFTRAYLRATIDPSRDETSDRDERLGAALIAGMAAADDGLLAPLRESFSSWQDSIARDGLDIARATVVRLATDGLWLTELLGLGPLSTELRRAVAAELEALASPRRDERDHSCSGASTRPRPVVETTQSPERKGQHAPVRSREAAGGQER
jgi:AcrR family transcriptional regulator